MADLKVLHDRPNDDIVGLLEEILEDAKAGKVISIAVSGERKNRDVFTAFNIGDGSIFTLSGAIDQVKLRMMTEDE